MSGDGTTPWRERPSPNHDARPADESVDALVLHYTGMESGAAAIQRLCDPDARVSSHWLIEEDGTVWRLVPEERRAWHAGRSWWRGRAGLNDRSIGIEIVNPGHRWGPAPYPEAQFDALTRLAAAILARHPIQPWGVVGHSDIAPDRKQDPGEWFPWQRLSQDGIGLWPEDPQAAHARSPDAPAQGAPMLRASYPSAQSASAMPTDALGSNAAFGREAPIDESLGRIGYPLDCGATQGIALALAIAAFQRRFRPALVDGRADAATTRLAASLAARLPPWR